MFLRKENPIEQGLKHRSDNTARKMPVAPKGKSNRTRIETSCFLRTWLGPDRLRKENPIEQGLKRIMVYVACNSANASERKIQ